MPWRRGLQLAWKAVVYAGLSFLCLVVLAWLTLQWGILPHIEDWRPEIERHASRAVGVPVRIGHISVRSSSWIPALDLRDVVLRDASGAEALRLPRVSAALSPQSLLVLSPRLGIVNEGLGFFGVPAIDFLGNPDYFRHIYVWSDVWQTTGYSAVIYLAALSGIDPALHESAKIDGASRIKRILNVDLPGIMPTAVVMLILGVGNMMAIGFEKAYLLQNNLNLAQSEIIPTYVYKTGLINADFSMATAVGLFNSVVNLCLLLVVNFAAKRITGNGLWR